MLGLGGHTPPATLMDKPTFSDMPAEALWELGKTYTLGTKKHGLGSWREPCKWTEVYDAMMRHMLQWRMGEDKSDDDHHYHMGAIAHRALWLLTYHLDLGKYKAYDDRHSEPQSDKRRSPKGQQRPTGADQRKTKAKRKSRKEQNHDS